MSKLSGAFFSCAGLSHGKNRGEQCGTGSAAKLKTRVENGVAVRLELGRDLRQATGHHIRIADGIEQTENEIESGEQHGRKLHREHQHKHWAQNSDAERNQNRLDRAELIVEPAAKRGTDSADQCAGQHQRAGHKCRGAERELCHIGDDIAVADGDQWQQQICAGV